MNSKFLFQPLRKQKNPVKKIQDFGVKTISQPVPQEMKVVEHTQQEDDKIGLFFKMNEHIKNKDIVILQCSRHLNIPIKKVISYHATELEMIMERWKDYEKSRIPKSKSSFQKEASG